MSLPAVQSRPQAARNRSLIMPREHGAWGILLVPLLTGAGVGLMSHGRVLPLALLVVAALALFWMRTPLENLLGTTPIRPHNAEERRLALTAVILLATAAVGCLVALFWHGENMGLLAIGGLAALTFFAQAGLKRMGRATRMSSQMIGSVGLTCAAPAAYYVVTTHLNTRALGLWLVNVMFAGDQIHFVQARIHAARVAGRREKVVRARGFLLGQIAMVMALVLACRLSLLPAVALLAFVPVVVRGTTWFFAKPEPLNVRRLGLTELAHAIAFGILLLSCFYFSA